MKRIKFGQVKDFMEIPNLIEHQIKSFEHFKHVGIQEVLSSVFPISDHNGMYEFHFLNASLGEPAVTTREAKRKNLTYSAPLTAEFMLINHMAGGTASKQTVFLGDMPYMTDEGKFIANGNERTVIAQLSKSPGVYFESKINEKGKVLYEAKIQPDRGAWLRFETDSKDVVHVRINKTKKVLLTVFLKAFGVGGNEELIRLFGENKYILATLEKDTTESEGEAMIELYKKVRPSDPAVLERAQTFLESTFFDPKKFDLERVGRYKMNQKLNLRQRVLKMELEDGTIINDEVAEKLGETEVFIRNKEGDVVKVIGNGSPDSRQLTVQDLVSTVNYLINMDCGVGGVDNVDHLANRRLRMVGESMQKQFLVGIKRMEKIARDKLTVNASNASQQTGGLTPQDLVHVKPIVGAMREFLTGQLSQYVEQINPLAELSNKRRISALGPGGLVKERASVEVRDVHYSHYGKQCPIETPEGASVGLIGQISVYAKTNEYGFLTSPYRKVDPVTHRVTEEVAYLTADEEEKYYIAQASDVGEDGVFKKDRFAVRYGKEYPIVRAEEVEYADVSSKQPFGIGACLIPFLENDDANRAVMGANMQRQGLPLVAAEEPLVGTGIERRIAVDTRASIVAADAGVVTSITDGEIAVKYGDKESVYQINKFSRTNNDTCWNHYVRVHVGQKVEKGTVLADSNSSNNGELAVGQNLLVAFMPMEGYNFEDSVVLSSRIAKEDALTTIMISEYKTDIRESKLGPEEVTREVPDTGEKQRKNLDEEGIVRVGTYVKGGDILVGKRKLKPQDEKSAQDRMLDAIFDQKGKDYKDTSLRLDHGQEGYVKEIIRNTKADGADLKNGVQEEIKVLIVEKRKIDKGDKMAGRHGNKGVVSTVWPEEDMPYLEDGTPVDVVLNPLGVPSRMNIGQIMEVHLGMVARHLGVKFETPVFGGVNPKVEIQKKLTENGLPANGKFPLYDGRTGEKFEHPVTVGVMYMMKLNHQVRDKMHARSTGSYSLITQQPLGGKAQMGGQRVGEMEVWALESYGAAYTLQEILTLKSDDVVGRTKLLSSIVKGTELPEPRLTEGFRVLMYGMRGLALDTDIVTKSGKELFKPVKVERPVELQPESKDDGPEHPEKLDLGFE